MKQLSKSYMLRTGQMRLTVRAIKPVTQDLPVVSETVNALPDLSVYPIIGEYYLHKGEKVRCIESFGCSGCICNTKGCNADHLIRCMKSKRPDGKSVIFIKVD